MAKEPAKPLPSPDDVPSAAPLVAAVGRAKARVRKTAEAATVDGELRPSTPAYRAARKRLKRAQRRLRRELRRVGNAAAPAAADAGGDGGGAAIEGTAG